MTLEEEMIAIKGKKTLLTAEAVVAWAEKHRDSKVAAQLEWDNAKAGHEFRLNQARQLIITLEITIGKPQRRFYSLSIDRNNKRGGGYRDISDIMRSESLYEILLQDALNDLKRMEERYERLKELKPLWRQIDKIRKRKAKGDERPQA
jgi:hypothetical protein